MRESVSLLQTNVILSFTYLIYIYLFLVVLYPAHSTGVVSCFLSRCILIAASQLQQCAFHSGRLNILEVQIGRPFLTLRPPLSTVNALSRQEAWIVALFLWWRISASCNQCFSAILRQFIQQRPSYPFRFQAEVASLT